LDAVVLHCSVRLKDVEIGSIAGLFRQNIWLTVAVLFLTNFFFLNRMGAEVKHGPSLQVEAALGLRFGEHVNPIEVVAICRAWKQQISRPLCAHLYDLVLTIA
jgi:hypothetical protein